MQDVPKRIAIAGAGVAGSLLYRALTDLGRTVDIYDLPHRRTACGIHSCAWGVSADFFRWMQGARADPAAYIANRITRVDFGGQTVPAEIYLLDKPRLIRELLDGAPIRSTPIPAGWYDRVLDCTGAARAYLPPTMERDVLCDTIQMRIYSSDFPDDTIQLRYWKVGYCWLFPLGNHRFHLGAGGFPKQCGDLHQMLESAGFLDGNDRMAGCRTEQICGCESTIRLTGPLGARPHVAPDSPSGCPVWGVGESIGTVSPISGEGITHALQCAALYLAHERDARAYSEAVVREFSRMAKERGILEKAMTGRWFSLSEWRAIQQNAARMGIRVGVAEILAVLRELLRHRWIRLADLIPGDQTAR
ncbi:MAG: hypothetical protein KO206_08705 [Methanomicrobiaceae archaeon]|uniref:Menaquinone-specific polyprenyl reductase n=1 Tax=hydrocarbon metagenome TaxID=938273 RepID=A0A0W8FHL1_9ZZZZ|nr:hypothetical protein [Methanomicrobiaceae archaeon]